MWTVVPAKSYTHVKKLTYEKGSAEPQKSIKMGYPNHIHILESCV